MAGEMRTGPAARNADFRGIDPPALNHLIKQMQDAERAIKGWLNGHRPPPGVSAAGHRQAEQVAQWTADQLGMLTRRYHYAITHPDRTSGVQAPAPPPRHAPPDQKTPQRSAPVHPPPSPQRPPSLTPSGAGDDLGNFATRQEAAKAAKTDALAVGTAVQGHKPVPDEVWAHLKANADDPDYAEKLYERLGPATADLLKAADSNETRLAAIGESLGAASHHHNMDVRWLKTFLAEAEQQGVHPIALQVLAGADLSHRTQDAIEKLNLAPHRKAG